MRSLFTFLLLISCVYQLSAQSDKDPDNKSVPQSSAFKLVDISPTLIETPTTPKAFGLGVLQSFGSDASFPQNYSAEFTPYWWALPKNRDAYKFLGIRREEDPITKAPVYRSSPFSALKMTNVSVAFLQKDMIPDNKELTQKVVSAGLRTTIIRIYSAAHTEKLNRIVNDILDFQTVSIEELVNDPDFVAARGDSAKMAEATMKFADRKKSAQVNITSLRELIETHIAQKPTLQWDLSAAYATYGIADTTWKTGRVGVWSTISVNHLLNAHGESPKQNYLTVSAYGRYMYDNYALENGLVTNSGSYDVGGRLSFEFDPFSIGFEAVHRNYTVAEDLKSQRVVGFMTYRLGNDLYLNGAFGNDFGVDQSKVMALFGINWGFGNEKLSFKD